MNVGHKQELILGPPGCGKTTTLLAMVEEALKQGIQPEEIAFVSFTRKAILEAVDRACKKFGFKPRRFPYFQTVHSLCFHQLGCTKNNLMSRQDFMALGEWLGYDLTGQVDMADGVLMSGAAPGDKFLFLDNIARARCQTIREAWENEGFDIAWAEQERFSRGYARYKQNAGLMDFTDLLHRYIEQGVPTNVKIAVIDEAQDLSRAQWRVLEKCFAHVPEVYIAGDDDQSIYKWSGADLDTFLSLEGDRRVLSQSYRLPRTILEHADKVIKGIRNRFEKEYAPTAEEGTIDYVNSLEMIDFKDDEKTLILGRNVYLLSEVYEHMQRIGLTYTGRGHIKAVKQEHVHAIVAWERMRKGEPITHADAMAVYAQLRIGEVLGRGGRSRLEGDEVLEDGYTVETLRNCYGLLATPVWHDALQGIPLETREFYLSVLRSQRKISTEPLVHINTIHGVKGGEAEHVVILSDMSKRTFTEYQKDPDSETRVAYVAITRAKKRLTIVMPRSRYSFPY